MGQRQNPEEMKIGFMILIITKVKGYEAAILGVIQCRKSEWPIRRTNELPFLYEESLSEQFSDQFNLQSSEISEMEYGSSDIIGSKIQQKKLPARKREGE